ncbi:acetyltransferase, GNAT family [Clostridiales bacterium oral taxon 876 str. F0540]|nr:acetyltransferase, GNAT family [Clostridiales bacterium oral taxon 876 str. F0540]
MRYITSLNDELKKKILSLLYEDELFNVFLIHFIENQIQDIGELYVEESNGSIDNILHMKFDGNSYFTSFFTKKENGYIEIAKQLQLLNYNRVLLAGKRKEVSKILSYLGKKETSTPDIYYEFDLNRYCKQAIHSDITYRMATCRQNDMSKISEYMIGFFEPTSNMEIADITDENKLTEDIKIGVYFIEYKGQPIGMARYSGKTKNYVDITTVYIDPIYRGKGFGKKLMENMVENIISDNRIPVTQTSSLNLIARKTYESMGFIKKENYSFEFIS